MSDTKAEYRIRAYHETPEHYALRITAENPDATPGAMPEPVTVARTQLGLSVREHGEVIDLDSIREVERVAVIVNEAQDDYREVREGDTLTGHIVTWACTASPRVASDAGDPVLDVEEDDDGVLARVPEPYASTGGAVRVRHNLHGEVTALAYKPDGEGIGYLLAMPLDDDTLHIEFFGGTAAFHITLDD